MTGCDATLRLMLNWSLANRLIEGFYLRDTDVVIVFSDGQTRLDFDDARAFMQSVVCGYARSSDSTIQWPSGKKGDLTRRSHGTF